MSGRIQPPAVEWDIKSGARLGEIAGNAGPFRRTALSPDGRTAVLESENQNVFRLVDAISGKLVAEFKLPGTVEATALHHVTPGFARPTQVVRQLFAPDSKTLVVVSEPPNTPLFERWDLQAIDVEAGRVKWKAPQARGFDDVRVSNRVVTGVRALDGGYRQLDLETGKEVSLPEAGRWSVEQGQGSVRVVDRSTKAVAFTIAAEAQKPSVTVKAAVHWKSMRVGFTGEYVGTWDIAAGELVQSLPGEGSPIRRSVDVSQMERQ